MILGRKYSPSALFKHPRGKAVPSADIQREAGLDAARNQLNRTTDSLAHNVGDSLAGAIASATGYRLELGAGAG